MESESIWLGPMRKPVRLGMTGFAVAAAVTFAWMAIQTFVAAEPVTMYDLLRPSGHILAQLLLFTFSGAILFTALFLSDKVGAIESKPQGFFDILSLVFSRISMIGIVCLVLVMFYEVVSRYAFNAPTLWANEMSLWMASFLFMLAGLYAMQQRSHIRIYVIYDIMPRWMKKMADVISVMLIWIFTFTLVWGGFDEAKLKFTRMETFGTAWDPPIPATLKPAILIIMCLVALQALSNLIADWHKEPAPHDDIDETEIENIRATLRGD
jgi:TRAP-type C4-dicarboxylate transport system permease small subunit